MTELSKKEWLCRFAGAASGLLLCAGNLSVYAVPLQAFCFIPIFLLATVSGILVTDMLVAGFYMAMAFILPQLVVFRFPVIIALGLLLYFTTLLLLSSFVFWILLRKLSVEKVFIIGFFLAALDWLNFTLVPVWGTAQSFSRAWSAYPFLIQFVSVTGITGIAFVLGALQALAVCCVRRPDKRAVCLTAIAAIVLGVAAMDIFCLYQKPAGEIKVAAIGWTGADYEKYGDVSSEEGFNKLYLEPVSQAAAHGARIIVSPEIGFGFDENQKQSWLEKFKRIAKSNDVYLVIGYCDGSANYNRLMYVCPDGAVTDDYVKTHMTIFEDFNKGAGKTSTVIVSGFLLGGLICQDDNFTDISRKYGRDKTSMVAIPTLDWQQVSRVHFQSTIHRAIESHFAIIRAAMNGISAIISPTGLVLASRDHFKQGPGLVMAEVPVFIHKTVFSVFGHWFAFWCAAFFVVYMCRHLLWRRLRQNL